MEVEPAARAPPTVPPATQILGSLETFDPATDTVAAYAERAELFFEVNNITADKKVPVFLNAVGKQHYQLLANLFSPDPPASRPLSEIVDALKGHYEPKPIVIAERFNFHRRQQGRNETVSQYIAELRKLSVHCQFGAYLEEALRDRFVCGLRSETVQKKLLVKEDLTFQEAIRIAQSSEQAVAKARQLQSQGTASLTATHVPTDICRLSTLTMEGGAKSCYRCGKTDHNPAACKFRSARCYHCDKIGHLASVCRQKQTSTRPQKKPRNFRIKAVNEEVTETLGETDCSEDLMLYTIRYEGGKPLLLDVSLNGKPLTMELDTGAAVSLVSERVFQSLLPEYELVPSRVPLRTYSGERMEVLGVVEVTVTYCAQHAKLPLYVVRGTGPSLFGRSWLESIRPEWESIQTVQSVVAALPKVLEQHKAVFEGLGELKGHKAKILIDPNAQPRYCKARPVPYALKEKVDQELDRLQREGIIEPVQFAEWAAPVVPVLKQDKKSLRLCGDFKLTVNKVSKLDKYPIPKIEDLFAQLAGGKSFSKLDMSQAYQQLVLDEESREYVVINTHRGLFRYNRLPFGVSSAPGIFQRVMESVLRGIPGVVVYLDDILITSPTDEEHVATLAVVLARLKEAGLRLKREKCVFLAPSVTYLGHRIDAEGLHPMKEKVQAIQEAPQPNNTAELRSYLGLLSYYSKFLQNLSTVLAPLYKLLKLGEPWCWTSEQAQAFNKSKQLIVSSQVLVHFDPKLRIRLACDASDYGIGAVLSHVMPDGSEKPVGFVSRSLTASERKYSQIEKEALACVVGVTRFHSYLWGHHFTLQTDHKPLLTLFNESKPIPQQAANRIQRWAWKLASYEYSIEWRASDQHSNADALSRLPLPQMPADTTIPAELVLIVENMNDAPVTAEQVASLTRREPLMAEVYRYIQEGWPTQMNNPELKPYWTRRLELSTLNGCIVWGVRVVVPPQAREAILAELHSGHPGCTRMKSVARGLMWWPGIDRDIERTVKQCMSCQQCQSSPPSAPLQPWVWPSRPWSRLHIDFAGPVAGTVFLVLIDAHSKWIEVVPMTTATSLTTIQQLRQIFARFGLPETIVSDNGPQFSSSEFAGFCHSNGIRHILVSPYHPSSNGLAERAVRILKEGLKKIKDGSISDRLAQLLFQYRNTPHSTTGMIPAELLMGRKLRSRLYLIQPNLDRRVNDKQGQQQRHHDQHSKQRTFAVGERVYVKNHRGGVPWLPGVIVQVTGPVSYRVEMADGNTIRSHQDHIRRRFTEAEQPSEDEDDLLSQISEDPSLADADVSPHDPERHDSDTTDLTPAVGPQPSPGADPNLLTSPPPPTTSPDPTSRMAPPTATPQPRSHLRKRQVLPTKVYPCRDRRAPDYFGT